MRREGATEGVRRAAFGNTGWGWSEFEEKNGVGAWNLAHKPVTRGTRRPCNDAVATRAFAVFNV